MRCRTCALELATDLSGGQRPHPQLCASCIAGSPSTDAAFAGVTYGFPWAGLIASFKFGERPGWAAFFARLLLNSPGVRENMASLGPDDWLLPLPLSARRLEARGFNQSWEIARWLAEESATLAHADARLLLRIRDTRPQTELQRDARIANVRGAFAVDPLRAHLLKNRRVVLVDDVMTSGASLFAAAEALRDAGAAHVTALVVARTGMS